VIREVYDFRKSVSPKRVPDYRTLNFKPLNLKPRNTESSKERTQNAEHETSSIFNPMNYYTISPPASLAPYVRFFWVLESDEAYTHRSLADGCAELFFHYHGVFTELQKNGTRQSASLSGIQGPSQSYRRFTIDKGFGMFGIYFYPFAIPQLFGMPVSSLANQMPDLQSWLGMEGKELEERMMLASTNAQRVQIMVAFLEKRLRHQDQSLHPLTRAISGLIDEGKTGRVDELSAQYFLSMRQFERKFKALAGLSPKLYNRILRFQNATHQYKEDKKLTDIAYDCGYYDQSHFIHDFKEFSGLHPKAYFSGQTEATDWILD
jgi:AraC-like DNA-binding protein